MPKILDRVVSQLKAKGVANPYAVGVSRDAEGWQPEEGNRCRRPSRAFDAAR